jgi:hypothetical protein
MIENLIYLGAGLFIGWFFLDAPQFAVDAKNALVEKFPILNLWAKKNVDHHDVG